MKSATIQIQTATLDDVQPLARTIATAFIDLPLSGWLIDDPATRARIFPDYFAIFTELGIRHGIAHTTPDRQAVAIWLPVGPYSVPELPDYDARLDAVAGPWADRFRTFDALLEKHHPASTTHHWLAFLAVHPTHQRQGIGSCLLAAYHESLDRTGTPAYLEASSTRSRALYLRHGYVLRAGGPFYLPDGGPAMWPMWRDPARAVGQS